MQITNSDIANDPHSTANTAVPSELAAAADRGRFIDSAGLNRNSQLAKGASGRRTRSLVWQTTISLLLPAWVVAAGCGPRGLPSKPMHGSVTCGGQAVLTGLVTFMPIDGAAGANCAAAIVDGQYSIQARGGVPFGKHRVCVIAEKKTGRQVEGHNGRETVLVDEKVRIGPPSYSGEQSPLIVDIRSDSDDRYDIVLPGS